jgi:arsenate reductase
MGGGSFHGFSAGSHPTGEVNAHALALLRRHGHPVEPLRSKHWSEFASAGGPRLDLVITVCDNAAAEVCPVWPGQPMSAHRGLRDPAAARGSEAEISRSFSKVYEELSSRMLRLVNLPVEKLDRPTLQSQIAALGTPA